MPLPTSIPASAESVFAKVLETAQGVSTHARVVRASLASPVNVDNLVALYGTLNAAQRTGISLQGTPGLADYAREKLSRPDYDIDAAFMASIIAGTAVTEWLLANLPSDGAEPPGFVSFRKQPDGTIARAPMSAEALAPLAPLLDDLLATFEG